MSQLSRALLLRLSASFLLAASYLPGIAAHAEEHSTSAVAHETAESKPESAPSAASKSDTPKSSNKTADAKSPAESKSAKILPSDVRVLIDVSGSMNLRKPALDLIVRLLPDKSRAGVWTFGNSVNMLVPLRTVDASWRKEAAPKAQEINSIAMYTNIGKGLDEVSFDRKNLSADYKTHIILLTDGVVDIGKDAVGNSTERKRILTEVLPGLKAAGYKLHTIALSANADMELMKKLSLSTDGVFTTATSAEQLMGVFLKIFDQAVPAERVPLENNGFMVDASIKEFTALIFRKPGNDKTVLLSPDGKEFSDTSGADKISWYRTDKYDLITATEPKTGQWKIKTDIAPESRVTVVSNLQLVMEPLKNNLFIGDLLTLNYVFQENGKTITNKDFLKLLDASVTVTKAGGEALPPVNASNVAPDDGRYQLTANSFNDVGDYEVHLVVDGKTFKREFKHNLSVRDSMFTLEKSQSAAEDGKTTYNYKINLEQSLADPKKVQVNAVIKGPGDTKMDKVLSLQEPNRWEFNFTPVQPGDYVIEIQGQGEALDSSQFDETLRADSFSLDAKAASSAAAEAHEAEPEQEKPEEPAKKDSNWLLYAGIAFGNLLLAGLGYLAYRMLLGGGAKAELNEFEQTLAQAEKKAAPAKAKEKEKEKIDISDDSSKDIPMNDDASMDKLFPLDSMDDPDDDPNNR
jgi:uncharacterized protein (TIGR03503 family)